MTEPYRPSNGSEGEWFMSEWCAKCKRDEAHRNDPEEGDGCDIIIYAMAFGIDDPKYPKEWVEDDSGPRCTAFQPVKP